MGNYRVEVDAVGGHGCMREVGDGQVSLGCGQPGCPDCIARQFVKRLKESGNTVSKALLTHWPGEKGEVKDDLLTGKRAGHF